MKGHHGLLCLASGGRLSASKRGALMPYRRLSTPQAPSSKRQRGLLPAQHSSSQGSEWKPRLPLLARPATSAWAQTPTYASQSMARGPKPVITVDNIGDLPPEWHMQKPEVSGIDGRLLESVSKYLTYAARHDGKTPATAEGFIMLNDLCRKSRVIRAFSNLKKSGVPATADVIAAIALYLSKASKLRLSD